MLVPINDVFLFHNLREKYGETLMCPIALTVLIVSDDHVNNTVMNPSFGTWMNNRDELLA